MEQHSILLCACYSRIIQSYSPFLMGIDGARDLCLSLSLIDRNSYFETTSHLIHLQLIDNV